MMYAEPLLKRKTTKNRIAPTRFSTRFLKAQDKKDLIVVELGVHRASNAHNLLHELDIKKLYLVDAYTQYKEYLDLPNSDMNKDFEAAEKLLEGFEDKIEWIKEFTNTAIHLIPDDCDFIYIDANHNYEYCKEDLLNYWLKVKKGGILAGHDYEKIPKKYGVKKAVDEWIKENKLILHQEEADWWVVK